MKHAVVIGGGVAGCSTAYALAKRGIQVTLLEQHAVLGSEGSGNPCAMLYPRLSGNDHLSEFALAGYLHSLSLFKSLPLLTSEYSNCGMLQLGFNERELARIQKVAELFTDNNNLQLVTRQYASQLAGVEVQHAALHFPDAGWVKPSRLLQCLTAHEKISTKTLTNAINLLFSNNRWHVNFNENQSIEADIVVIANANAANNFRQSAHIQTQSVRGQISLLTESPMSKNLNCIVCSDGYLSPAVDSMHSLGATYSTVNTELELNAADHQTNFYTLKMMSDALYQDFVQHGQDKQELKGRVGFRCTTYDYLPLLGQLLDSEALQHQPPRPSAKPGRLPWLPGLYINAAHGSKGFTSAPLCAELLAALICHESLPISESLTGLLNPNRFILRDMGLKQLAKAPAISS